LEVESIRDKRINKIRAEMSKHWRSVYTEEMDIKEQYDFMPLINGGCHHNAVHAVKKGDAVAVVECLIIKKNDITAHYINMDSDGDFIDFTLGWGWAGSDYRFIRFLNESEYGSIHESLILLKKKLCGGRLGLMEKLLNIDHSDLS